MSSAAVGNVQLLRPTGDVRMEWYSDSKIGWSKLDDPVQQPSPVAAGSDFLWAGGNGKVVEVRLAHAQLSGGDPLRGTAWFYANTGTATQLRVEVVWYGQVRASITVPALSGFQWRAIPFNVSTQAEADDLHLRFTSESGPNANLRAAYVELSAPQVTEATLRPQRDLRCDWWGGPGAWSKLDDPIQQPAFASGTDDALWAGAAGRVVEVGFRDPGLGEGGPAPGTAWFYANTGAGTQLLVQVIAGGQVRGSITVPGSSAFRWRSLPYALSASAESKDLRLRFTALGGPDANLRAAYLEQRPRTWRVTVLGSTAKIRPHHVAEGPVLASLVAARNEFESFQVVVRASGQTVRRLNIWVEGPLTGPSGAASIPPENLTIYRQGYYSVITPSDLEGAPGRWPDPLIPKVDPIVGELRSAFPIDVPAEENRAAWIDVQVPANAAPGIDRGTLDVSVEGGLARVPIQLKVLDLTLPSTTSLKSSFGLNTGSECAALRLPNCATDSWTRAYAKQLFVRAALDNRISIAYAHAIPITAGSSKGVAEFRSYTLPFVWGTAATRLQGARLTSYQVNRVKDLNLAGWRAEVRGQGFEDRAFVYSCDEPEFFPVYGDPAGNWEVCRVQAEIAQAEWPEAPKLITTHIQSSSLHDGTRLVDIMVLNLELLEGPVPPRFFSGNQRPLYDSFLADAARPKELWLYLACGSHGCTRNDDPYTNGWGGYEIDAPGSSARSIAWLAFRYDASGTLYYDMGSLLSTAWETQYRFTGNGEGTLFYPGTPDRIGGTRPIPIPSLRMKLIRDGYEDYEYLKFLREHGREASARQVARDLFPAPYRTARSDADVQKARQALTTMVAEVVGQP